MVAHTYTAGVLGIDGFIVTVEAEVGLGLPGITMLGQISGALVEARDRVRAALGHCGVELPARKTVVNLAPADVRKSSPGLDLAVASALLSAYLKPLPLPVAETE